MNESRGTGHLQLIWNRSLRDSLFCSFLLDQGITWWPGSMNTLGGELNDLDRSVQQRPGGNGVALDSAFAQPAGAGIWEDVRRITLMRIRVTEAGRLLAESLVERTRELKSAIDQ